MVMIKDDRGMKKMIAIGVAWDDYMVQPESVHFACDAAKAFATVDADGVPNRTCFEAGIQNTIKWIRESERYDDLYCKIRGGGYLLTSFFLWRNYSAKLEKGFGSDNYFGRFALGRLRGFQCGSRTEGRCAA